MSNPTTVSSNPSASVDTNTPLFPIREVARQTGINPVTLRAWERRYGLIKPLRTAKGHRMYSLEHLEQIRKVLDWLERGVAVSQVKRLIEDHTQPQNPSDSPWQAQQNQWLDWIELLAERKLDEGFKQAMALYPPETLCQHLLLPLLAKLQQHGTLMDGARVEQVFFLTWLRTQLASRIAQNNRLHSSTPLLIVSLSEQAMEPELWLCAWLVSYSECAVQVFEWPIPAPDLSRAIKRLKPRAVLLHSSQRLQLEQLRKLLLGIDCPVLLSGPAVSIHQEALTQFSQLTCSIDPLQTYQNLLRLNLLQKH